MSNILDVLKNAPSYIGGNGKMPEEIKEAEKMIGVGFALDYRNYLEGFGLASFNGHELTGICKSQRLNVVDVTLSKRKLFPEASFWYVVEEANIDGIVIWQATSGDIYQTAPGMKTCKVFDSLTEYIERVC